MSSMATNSIALRMQVLGFKPREYVPIVRLIQYWTQKSGEEWTCGRLKDVRQMFLHWSLDLPYEKATRVETDSRGVPKGPLRVLFQRGNKRFLKAWNALMAYTGFVSAKLTNKQWSKFIGGVERPPLQADAFERAKALVVLGLQHFNAKDIHFPIPPGVAGEPVERYPFRQSKRKYVYPTGSVPETESFWPSVRFVLNTSMGFLRNFPNISGGSLARFGFTPEGKRTATALIGTLSVIQEPGYKARIVANPNIVYQQLLRPMFSWLVAVNERLPGNFQFDQERGKQFVSEQLSKGLPAVSVDSSGWTDHFPRALSIWAMSQLGLDEEWLRCYDLISGGEWKVPAQAEGLTANCITTYPDGTRVERGVDRKWTRWTVGQPLGLLPTFNGATLAHVSLAMGIQIRCSEGPTEEPRFAIVGDDIVWFDLECAEVYMSLLDGLGVPVSRDKTLASDRAAEFCSAFITGGRVVPSLKWKMASDDSFVDVCRNLGPRSVKLLRKRQRNVIEAIALYPEPFGLGWNKEGISYWDRMSVLQSSVLLKSQDVKLKSLVSISLQNWYNSSSLDHATYASRSDFDVVSVEQTEIQVLSEVFGLRVSQWLSTSLCEHIATLSAEAADEARLYGSLSQGTLRAFPKALADRLDGLSGSAAIAELALVVSRLERAMGLQEQTQGGVYTKLQQLEGFLLRTALQLKSKELKAMRKR